MQFDPLKINESTSVALGRARAGICALIEVLGLQGCSVIIPANICPAVVVAILAAKAVPVLCDTNMGNGLADDASMALMISQGGARGMVMPSHLCGLVQPYPKTMAVAREKGWFILENDSQGTIFHTQALFGDALLISYGAGKVIDAGGGGEIISQDKALIDGLRAHLATYPALTAAHLAREEAYMLRRRALRGMTPKEALAGLKAVCDDEVRDVRTKATAELIAAIKAAKLQADTVLKQRFERYRLWQEALRGCASISWPTAEMAAPWRVILTLPNDVRNRAVTSLRAKNIDAGTNYPCVADAFPWLFGDGPASSHEWASGVLNLWLDARYDQARIDHTAHLIKEAFDA